MSVDNRSCQFLCKKQEEIFTINISEYIRELMTNISNWKGPFKIINMTPRSNITLRPLLLSSSIAIGLSLSLLCVHSFSFASSSNDATYYDFEFTLQLRVLFLLNALAYSVCFYGFEFSLVYSQKTNFLILPFRLRSAKIQKSLWDPLSIKQLLPV